MSFLTNCVVCERSSDTGCIQCTNCSVWVHFKCAKIVRKQYWDLPHSRYYCIQCSFTNAVYNFQTALARLQHSTHFDLSARNEQLLLELHGVSLPAQHNEQKDWPIDEVSEQILKQCHPQILLEYVPLAVVGDGNCLYRACSLGLYGDETHHVHLRLLTAIEIILNAKYYSATDMFDVRINVSPYDELVSVAVGYGRYAEFAHVKALSAVIGVSIQTYYPPLKLNTYLSNALSCCVVGRGVKNSPSPLTIMWTQTTMPSSFEKFAANHFCVFHRRIVGVSPSVVVIPDNSTESDSSDSDHSEESDQSYASVEMTSNNSLLKGRYFNSKTAIELIVSANLSKCLDRVPPGVKENVFFLINEPSKMGNVRQFPDDCGAWSSSTSSPTTIMLKSPDGSYKVIKKCGERYGVSKKNGDFMPLVPQPETDCIFILQRVYYKLAASANYSKKITSFSGKKGICLVEYCGTFPERRAHGNATFSASSSVYVRTDPTVLSKIDTSGKPKMVYREMCLSEDSAIPKDTKQIRNKKYNTNKNKGVVTCGNIVDNIMAVENMVYENEFVQQVVHNKGAEPSVILYLPEQIQDMKSCCEGGKSVIGLDKTYNLGPFFVTPCVYKNPKIIRADTNTNPILMGPVFIHGTSTQEVFSIFLYKLA
jgi:hypothetical protein